MNFMDVALDMARRAEKKGEVPIGAVVVRDGKILSKAFNKRERKQNACAHAEILAIEKACKRLGSWRLEGCEIYVTLQPCVMCAGAILNARISKVIIGALSDRTNDMNIYRENNLNWKTEVVIQENIECGEILKRFFKRARSPVS